MTRQEAIELETKLETALTDFLGKEVEFSMALTSRLRVTSADWFINFEDDGEPSYIKYVGDYDDLKEYLIKIKQFFVDNAEELKDLKWTYNHQSELTDEPKWNFTDDEKVILRNLSKEYKWIARDKDGDVFIYNLEPIKRNEDWKGSAYEMQLDFYSHLFQSIQWTDDEPCNFREIIGE